MLISVLLTNQLQVLNADRQILQRVLTDEWPKSESSEGGGELYFSLTCEFLLSNTLDLKILKPECVEVGKVGEICPFILNTFFV